MKYKLPVTKSALITYIEVLKEKNPSSRNKEFPIIIESMKEFSYQIIEKNPMIPTEAAEALKKTVLQSAFVS